jgi:hypothetical protein
MECCLGLAEFDLTSDAKPAHIPEQLIDYILFYFPLKNISLIIMKTSPLPVKGCKI